MRLITLRLKNFKGVADFVLHLGGKNAAVFGDNGAGKTTLADGLSWLLFDKDSKGNSKFEIKTLDANNQPIHNLEHAVYGSFDLGDGKCLELAKVYAEKWTKKRGSNNEEFTGHTTDYSVDGVPVQMKEYKAKVAEIVTEEMARLLTSPSYFSETLPWQQRRSVLMEVCGDISDADVVAADKELAPLAEIMATRKLEDHKKVLAAGMKKINDSLKTIPVRIDEVRRSMPEAVDVEVEEKMAGELQAQKSELEAEYAKVEAGQDGGLKAEIAKIDGELLEMKSAASRKHRDAVEAEDLRLRAAKGAVRDMEEQIEGTSNKLKSMLAAVIDERAVNRLAAEMAELRAEWDETSASVYQYVENICPTCGQEVLASDDAEEQFEIRKAAKLAAINTAGKEAKVKHGYALSHIVQEKESRTCASWGGKNRQSHCRTQRRGPDHRGVPGIGGQA